MAKSVKADKLKLGDAVDLPDGKHVLEFSEGHDKNDYAMGITYGRDTVIVSKGKVVGLSVVNKSHRYKEKALRAHHER